MSSPSASVRVSNLAASITPANLQELFSGCGKILSLEKETPDSYIITFADEAEAQVAVLLADVPLCGKNLQVQRIAASVSAKADVAADLGSSSRSVTVNGQSDGSDPLSRTLYVGNLPAGVTADQITALFASNCKVSYVKLSGTISQNTTYAFVEFETLNDAKVARDMNGIFFMGKNVKIGQAQAPIGSGLSENSNVPKDPASRLAELKNKLAQKYGAGDSKSDHASSSRSPRHDSSSRRRSRSGERRRRSSSSDRRRLSYENSRDRNRRDKHFDDRRSRHSRYDDRPRKYDNQSRKKREDPHEGMFWDGFQWIPAATVTSITASLPGVGVGLRK